MSNIEQQLETAEALLHLHFGHEKFRLGQKEIIQDLFSGDNVIAIMPTGGGKSLCYQLPALCLDGITLVVSPLIALMKDQVDSLENSGISATFINSSLSQEETSRRIQEIKKGNNKIVYITPERFYNQKFVALIKQLKVSLIAIDEAHCISQWGHDFRPSYTRIKDFIKMLDHPQIIALTATATPEVKEDIIVQLGLESPKIHITGFDRPNLHYTVIRANDYQKLDNITTLVQDISGSGIIYANTRDKVDAITDALINQNISVQSYHAGMEKEDRSFVQDKFMSGEIRIIVATNAFGMGIDKSNIRFVIHFDLPGTMEAYYQEAGRAGRDGKISQSVLFYHPSDRYLREFFINNENPSPKEIKQIYQILISYDLDIIHTTYTEIKAQTFNNISEMSISSIIKILEKYGIIQRPKDKENDASIKFLADSDDVLNQINSRAKAQKMIIEELISSFGISLQEGVKLKVNKFLDTCDISKSTFTKTLNTLKDKKLIEYTPPFRGTEIKVLKNIPPEKLGEIISFESLENKKDSSMSKLDYMESYVFTDGCRRKYILKYFGDDTRDLKCDGCDYCIFK